jgi:raffinose/stachyose/melibiose transport system substrate-binding protein
VRARKILAAVIAAGSMVGALSACGGGEQKGSSTNTLTFFSWDNEQTMAPYIKKFESENPGVKIQFSNAPPVAEYISTLQTRVLAGTAADVFYIAAENKSKLIEGKLVVDLTDEPFMKNVAKFNKDTYSADGRAYGMSTSSWGSGFLYNKALLSKVGADTVPQTWDEFLDLCAKLKAAGVTPYLESVQGMPTALSAFLGAQSAQQGGTMDEKIFNGESSFAQTWVQPLTEWNKLWERDLVTKDVVGLQGDQVRDEFAKGKVAMIPAGPWDIPSLRKAAPKLQYEMALVPAITSGTPYLAGAASPGLAINAKAKNPELAKKFLAFMDQASIVEQVNKLQSAITTTSDYKPTIDPALMPIVEPVRGGKIYLPQIAWKRQEDVLNVEATAQLQRMIRGQATPQQVAEALDKKLKDADR